MIYVRFIGISVANYLNVCIIFVVFIFNQKINSNHLYAMKKEKFIQVIPGKIKRFLRPMFYNGRSGQVQEGQKADKDQPWFT